MWVLRTTVIPVCTSKTGKISGLLLAEWLAATCPDVWHAESSYAKWGSRDHRMPSRKHLRFPNVKDKPVVIVLFFVFLNANSCNFMEYSINFPLFFYTLINLKWIFFFFFIKSISHLANKLIYFAPDTFKRLMPRLPHIYVFNFLWT